VAYFTAGKPYRLRGSPAVAIASSAGVATVVFGPPVGQAWELSELQLYAPGSIGATATIFVGDDATPGNFHSVTPAGNNDIWTGDPITLLDAELLTIAWAGLQPGGSAWARGIVTPKYNASAQTAY